jgi:hypothetical protein
MLRDAVKQAVVHAVSALTYEEPIASMIKSAARKQLRRAIAEALKD